MDSAPEPTDELGAAKQQGSQTLLRGLDVLDAVADGPINLTDLATKIGLTRSTTHRLANALIERRYLSMTPRLGYQFGPKLLQLGFLAQQQANIVQIARPHLERLCASSGDTTHLGVLDEETALYLEKLPGGRRVVIGSRVGDRQPLTSTGIGKALLLGAEEATWQARFEAEQKAGAPKADYPLWLDRMRNYVALGHAFDLEENEDQIRCVAAPVRNASGGVVAGISVSSAAQYMDDARMQALAGEVRATAAAISADLGWAADT